MDFPDGSYGEESACNERDPGSVLGSRRSPGGEWLPTPVFLPGEFHGHRSLAGYSPSMGSQRVRHNRATNTQRHTRFQQSQSLIHTQTSSPQPKCSRIPIFNLLIYQLSSMKILFKNLLIVRED